MLDPRATLQSALKRGPAVGVMVVETAGSTPRDTGAWMIVTTDAAIGSIGGGALEFAEIAQARALLDALEAGRVAPGHRARREIMLGIDAEQCCGGVVTLEHVVFAQTHGGSSSDWTVSRDLDLFADRHDARPRLTLYGAGHVGRALVRVLHDLPIAVDWVDIARDRFPESLPADVEITVAEDPAAHARAAKAHGLHLVMTHAHALDEAICAVLLTRGDFAWLGLIGSKTKRARFLQRFRRAGVPEAAIARLVSPVGIAGIDGKEPGVIAVAIAAQLLTVDIVRRRLARDPIIGLSA